MTTTTAYDAAGNTTLTTDPAGNQTLTTFDALNRPVDVKQQSGGATPMVVSDKQTGYDGAGNVVSTVVDPAGKNLITTYSFDAANRTHTKTEPPAVPGATDASGQATLTTYSYDADGQVIQTLVTNQAVTNPVGKTTVTYDALGRPVEKQENGGTNNGAVQLLTTTYVHDADGRTTSTTDPNGQTTTATLDQLGQVTVLSRPDGTDSASYDQAGHTIQTANSTGHTVYTYDALWRVILEKHYDASGTLISTTSHAYDASGHELAPITTLANGTQAGLTYTYDALGRIATVSDNARTYSYDPNGQVGSMSVYSDAAKTSLAYQASYGYDPGTRTSTLNDLVGPTATALHTYSYRYDPANNITSVADAIGGASSSYTYDNLNELKTVTDGTGTTTFSYDANHNRQTMVAVVAGTSYTTRYTYDAQADQELLSKTDPSNKVTQYVYDTAGNLTSSIYDPTTLDPGGANQTTSYTYDTSGRLIAVNTPDGTANGTTISYTYDADGNRASKTVKTGGPAPITTTVRDVYQAGRIAYQTDGSGTTLATFSYDSQGVPASVQVGADSATAPRYFYVYNPHGDVVALVDASGNTVATYSYDVFGGVTASESLPGGWTNPYRYDGWHRVRYDSETGLYWMSVRAYDPTLGRFLSRDPLNRQPLVFTGQPYVYAGNNPLKNVDPSGQWFYAGAGDGGGGSGGTASSGSSSVQTTPGSNGGSSGGSGGPPSVNGCQTQKCLYDQAIRNLRGEVGKNAFIAGGIEVLSLLIAFSTGNQTVKRLELFLALIEVFTGLILPGLGLWIEASHPDLEGIYRTAQFVSGGLNMAAGVVTHAITLYKNIGWLAQAAVDAAVWAAQGAVEGVPGLLEQVTWQVAGGAISAVLNGVSDEFLAQYSTAQGELDREQAMSPVEWCAAFGNGACTGMPVS